MPLPWNSYFIRQELGARIRQNLDRLYGFFEHIDRGGRRIAFEPRGGAWRDATIRRLVTDLDLVHVVDPFLRKPVGRGLRYFRLHGRPAYHYHYRYSDADMLQLKEGLSKGWPNWVLFNNDSMADDARRFIERIQDVRRTSGARK